MKDAALRAHVWLVAALVPLLVRLAELGRLVRWLTPSPRRRPYRGIPAERIVAVVRRRLRRPRHMRRRACLREGLTLYHFLRLAGVEAELRFGVFAPPPEGGRTHAHCWVTVGEQALSAPPAEPVALVLTGEQARRLEG